jgi:hypothetical protein
MMPIKWVRENGEGSDFMLALRMAFEALCDIPNADDLLELTRKLRAAESRSKGPLLMQAATSIEVLAQQLYQTRKELDHAKKKLRELEGKGNGKAV